MPYYSVNPLLDPSARPVIAHRGASAHAPGEHHGGLRAGAPAGRRRARAGRPAEPVTACRSCCTIPRSTAPPGSAAPPPPTRRRSSARRAVPSLAEVLGALPAHAPAASISRRPPRSLRCASCCCRTAPWTAASSPAEERCGAQRVPRHRLRDRRVPRGHRRRSIGAPRFAAVRAAWAIGCCRCRYAIAASRCRPAGSSRRPGPSAARCMSGPWTRRRSPGGSGRAAWRGS